MSWKDAQSEAAAIYRDLRARHDPGFIRMILRALTRQLDREEKIKAAKGEGTDHAET